MKHKTIVIIAHVMLVVFGTVIFLRPMIFSPDPVPPSGPPINVERILNEGQVK